MSHNYYRNPKGRMIKLGIMFTSLCFSAYMLPKTLDKLGGSGITSLVQPGGGIGPEAQRILGQGGIDSLLQAEQSSLNQSNGGGHLVITPSGSTAGKAYQQLHRQAGQMAPIKVVGKPEETDPNDGAVAQEETPTVDQLLELLEEQKKGG